VILFFPSATIGL